MQISVIIPFYNEEGSIRELISRLTSVLEKLKKSYEIIVIDDGSTDKTLELLQEAKRKQPRLKIIKMRKNFGQTNAISTGFQMSKGAAIVVMDGDLQNAPEDIPKLLDLLEKGYAVASGWRKNRKDTIGKILFSKISNYLARKFTGIDIHDFGCSLKAYKREAIENIELYGEMHRFIPAIVAMNGFKVVETPVQHYPRKYGKTKYDWGRLTKGFLDLIYIKFWLNYSTRPLHLFGRLGLSLFVLGFFIALYKILLYILFAIPITVGPLLLLSALLVITSAQFFVFGFLSDIELRTYHRQHKNNKRIETIID